jgi:hypothetical protein
MTRPRRKGERPPGLQAGMLARSLVATDRSSGVKPLVFDVVTHGVETGDRVSPA